MQNLGVGQVQDWNEGQGWVGLSQSVPQAVLKSWR